MGLIERVGRAIALGDVPLGRESVAFAARSLLDIEAPLAHARLVEEVVGGVIGLGPLHRVLGDPEVTDILVNAPDEVWIDRGDGLVRSTLSFKDDEEIVTAVERVIAPLGLRIDRAAPMLDARLADGSRIHAVLPPASVGHPLLAVRRFTQRLSSLDDLVEAAGATPGEVAILREAVRSRHNIVVSGGTGAGKTTLLNLLAAEIPGDERVVTIEDAAELSLPGHTVRLEARPPNAEGFGEITVRQLLRSALRLRPDRIVLGEVRGAEALDLVSALNTGHHGSMTTVHANSPLESMWRLETLALTAGETSPKAVRRQLWAAVDLVVQIDRNASTRSISAVSRVTGPGRLES